MIKTQKRKKAARYANPETKIQPKTIVHPHTTAAHFWAMEAQIFTIEAHPSGEFF